MKIEKKEKTAESIKWEISEAKIFSKSWISLIVLGFLIAIGALIWMKNFLGAVVIGLGGLVLYFSYFKALKLVKVILSPEGIKIDNHLYPFGDLDYFRISEEQNEILLKHKKFYLPYLRVPFKNKDKKKIKKFLLKCLEEKE